MEIFPSTHGGNHGNKRENVLDLSPTWQAPQQLRRETHHPTHFVEFHTRNKFREYPPQQHRGEALARSRFARVPDGFQNFAPGPAVVAITFKIGQSCIEELAIFSAGANALQNIILLKFAEPFQDKNPIFRREFGKFSKDLSFTHGETLTSTPLDHKAAIDASALSTGTSKR